MIFKEYCESFLQLVKVYFSPHEDLPFDKIKLAVKDKLGLDTWREILTFFSDKFKSYSGIYLRGKSNATSTPESLDSALKHNMTSFKADFKEFLTNKLKRSKVFPVIA